VEELGKCPLELIPIYTVLKIIFSEKKVKNRIKLWHLSN